MTGFSKSPNLKRDKAGKMVVNSLNSSDLDIPAAILIREKPEIPYGYDEHDERTTHIPSWCISACLSSNLCTWPISPSHPAKPPSLQGTDPAGTEPAGSVHIFEEQPLADLLATRQDGMELRVEIPEPLATRLMANTTRIIFTSHQLSISYHFLSYFRWFFMVPPSSAAPGSLRTACASSPGLCPARVDDATPL